MQRVALVTGAGSGIGRAICRSLGKDGTFVIATDVSQAGLDETVSLALADGVEIESKLMDVTDSKMVIQTIEGIEQIDIAVNCAGWDSLMPFLKTDEEFWDKIIDLNYKGVLRVTHAVLPGMISRNWGRVVNIASDAGRAGSTGEAVYSGAKGGVIAFSKTVAREVARHGITVNSVCPGPTDTALLGDIIDSSRDSNRMRESMSRLAPIKRLGVPADIAAAVSYMASEEAGFVTGQTLSVSGGLTMM
ncbi:MAG: SDR family oxidoreductase [bacterium]|nr:SDR family oxidoreductase [Gammaproteobacteria bacterium]